MEAPRWFVSPRRVLMTQFLARGLLAGAFVLLIVMVVLTRLVEADTVANTVRMVDDHARTLSQMIGGQMHQLLATGAPAPVANRVLAQMVEQESQDEQLLNVLIVDAQNTIIGAKDRALVGQTLVNQPAAQAALNGTRSSQISEISGARVLRTATPIQVNGAVTYAILIDHSLAQLDAQLTMLRVVIGGLLALGFVATFSVLGVIVYHAGGEIERQEREKEQVKRILSAYVSPQVAQEWILPDILTEMAPLERSIFHLDGPQALRHLDLLLALPQLDAVQWVYGAGRGPAARWIDVYRRIRAAGKSIELLAEDANDALTMIDAIGVEGVWIRVDAPFATVDEANGFIQTVAQRSPRQRHFTGAPATHLNGKRP